MNHIVFDVGAFVFVRRAEDGSLTTTKDKSEASVFSDAEAGDLMDDLAKPMYSWKHPALKNFFKGQKRIKAFSRKATP